MDIRVSSPGTDLRASDVERIEKDLDKIARRLNGRQNVTAEVRIAGTDAIPGYQVTIEVDYGRNHLLAKSVNPDIGTAVRDAREEILRQINDRSRGGHSSFVKGR